MTTRRVIRHARAAWAARIAAEQIGRDAGFIDEHVVRRIVQGLRLDPATPRGRDISAALFGGVYGFF